MSSSGGEKKSALYTRTGDAGTTSLYDGSRAAKESPTFSVLGDIDELNAHLGLAAFRCKEAGNGLEEDLAFIQCRCLDMGASVATPRSPDADEETRKQRLTHFGSEHVKYIEKRIDQLDAALPRLTNFVLPSGGEAACALHIARVVARRAERAVWPLIREGEVESDVGTFINRLSDFLFAAARTAAIHEGATETKYVVSKHEASEVKA